jgi:hypothetical protein
VKTEPKSPLEQRLPERRHRQIVRTFSIEGKKRWPHRPFVEIHAGSGS